MSELTHLLIASAPDLLAEVERLRREVSAQAALIARDTATIANLRQCIDTAQEDCEVIAGAIEQQAQLLAGVAAQFRTALAGGGQ